ncbi:MAG TPA: class I SAM-dependent methyltransferase [Kribbella sp.]|nr:class I SAM-dependent methyltransferase [Kribbella sp.]
MGSIGERVRTKGFGQPEGLLGRFGGWLMVRGNGPTEKQLVQLAQLQPKDHVLVIGPGPGVGLLAAGKRAAIVVGVDPSETMLTASRQRCADLIETGKVQLIQGDAEHTHQPDQSANVVLSVNNVELWPDRKAALTEIHRVLKPNGRLYISAHQKWLPGGQAGLATDVERAGFDHVETWTWEPPGRRASTAVMLSARRPPH